MGKLLLLLTVFVLTGSFAALPEEGAGIVTVPFNNGSERADSLFFAEKQHIAQDKNDLAAKSLSIAKSFLGTPYVTGTLDQGNNEHLVLNFNQLDCWTFVENSVAIAMAEPGSFQSFKQHLQNLRYWGGHIDGYGSRIHYFTGWLLQAEKRGLLTDMTQTLGGIPYQKKFTYISERPNRYPKIKNAETLRDIQTAEKRLNAHKWFFIPKNRVAEIEKYIQEGDIISLTAWKPALDVTHQGFAVKIDGRIHLMHASSLNKKVIISKQPLHEYMATQIGQTGIMVARLK